MGVVRVVPTTAVVSIPTSVSVQASISDPSLIPNSVNLLQLNANGTTTVVGNLHDDGLNGDAFPADGVFTIVTTLNAASAGVAQLQVSATLQGVGAVFSPILSVFFQPADAPQQSIAALAQDLAAGDRSAALSLVVQSGNTTRALSTLDSQGLSALASMLRAATLVSSQDDLRIFQAPFVTPGGTTTTVEFSMVPGPNGEWLIDTW
jgi:hypothetical protein